MGSPELVSDVPAPPSRVDDGDSDDDEYDHSLERRPHSLQPIYSVLLKMSTDAPQFGTSERESFIWNWFVNDLRAKVQHALGKVRNSALTI